MPSGNNAFSRGPLRDESEAANMGYPSSNPLYLHGHKVGSLMERSSGALALELPSARAPFTPSRGTRSDNLAARPQTYGMLTLLVVAALWGSYSPVLKFLFSQPSPPSAALMTAAQALLAAAFLLAGLASAPAAGAASAVGRDGKPSAYGAKTSSFASAGAASASSLRLQLASLGWALSSQLRSALRQAQGGLARLRLRLRSAMSGCGLSGGSRSRCHREVLLQPRQTPLSQPHTHPHGAPLLTHGSGDLVSPRFRDTLPRHIGDITDSVGLGQQQQQPLQQPQGGHVHFNGPGSITRTPSESKRLSDWPPGDGTGGGQSGSGAVTAAADALVARQPGGAGTSAARRLFSDDAAIVLPGDGPPSSASVGAGLEDLCGPSQQAGAESAAAAAGGALDGGSEEGPVRSHSHRQLGTASSGSGGPGAVGMGVPSVGSGKGGAATSHRQSHHSGRGGGGNLLALPLGSLTAVGLELGTYNFFAVALGTWGVQRISATKVAFLGQATSLITPLLVAVSGQRVAAAVWVACCCGVLGSALVALDGSSSAAAAAAAVAAAGSGHAAVAGSRLGLGLGLSPQPLSLLAGTGVSRAMRLETAADPAALGAGAVHVVGNGGGSHLLTNGALKPAMSLESMGANYVLASCVFYALGTVRLGVHSSRFPPLDLAAASATAYAALSLVWLLVEMIGTPGGGRADLAELALLLRDNAALALVLWAGFGPGALSSYLQVLGQRVVPAAQAQMLYSSTPLWSALIARLLLRGRDGPMGPLAWLGGAVMLAASLMASLMELLRGPSGGGGGAAPGRGHGQLPGCASAAAGCGLGLAGSPVPTAAGSGGQFGGGSVVSAATAAAAGAVGGDRRSGGGAGSTVYERHHRQQQHPTQGQGLGQRPGLVLVQDGPEEEKRDL